MRTHESIPSQSELVPLRFFACKIFSELSLDCHYHKLHMQLITNVLLFHSIKCDKFRNCTINKITSISTRISYLSC